MAYGGDFFFKMTQQDASRPDQRRPGRVPVDVHRRQRRSRDDGLESAEAGERAHERADDVGLERQRAHGRRGDEHLELGVRTSGSARTPRASRARSRRAAATSWCGSTIRRPLSPSEASCIPGVTIEGVERHLGRLGRAERKPAVHFVRAYRAVARALDGSQLLHHATPSRTDRAPSRTTGTSRTSSSASRSGAAAPASKRRASARS